MGLMLPLTVILRMTCYLAIVLTGILKKGVLITFLLILSIDKVCSFLGTNNMFTFRLAVFFRQASFLSMR